MKIDVKPVEVDENLKLKKQVSQVGERAVSELAFNTGNVDLDKDLTRMFKQLEYQKQQMFEGNGGDGSIKNLFVSILDRTKDITDHKILPDEAIKLMFSVGTTVSLDHTLLKDTKMTQEEMRMKAETKVLNNTMDNADDILAGLTAKVKKNNEVASTTLHPTDPPLDLSLDQNADDEVSGDEPFDPLKGLRL